MFNYKNPYSLHTEIIDGITRYFVFFTDGEGIRRETEVSRPVYLEFIRFIKNDRNLRRWDERHSDISDLEDETIYEKMKNPPQSLEETVFESLRNEQLRLAIQELSEVQRRRFVLHHEFGLTYKHIAEMEGCSIQAAGKTIKSVEMKIKKYFSEQG